TAGAIAEACGWSVARHDHRIREGELGWMEDLPYTEVARYMAERQTRELDAHIHGGESLQTVAERGWEGGSGARGGHCDVLGGGGGRPGLLEPAPAAPLERRGGRAALHRQRRRGGGLARRRSLCRTATALAAGAGLRRRPACGCHTSVKPA